MKIEFGDDMESNAMFHLKIHSTIDDWPVSRAPNLNYFKDIQQNSNQVKLEPDTLNGQHLDLEDEIMIT